MCDTRCPIAIWVSWTWEQGSRFLGVVHLRCDGYNGESHTSSTLMSLTYRIAIAFLGMLLPTIVAGEGQVDPSIERVETGLLPVAAKMIGVSADIKERMRAYGVPGLSIAVVDQGRIAWAKGYGVADTTLGQPVTTRTLFQAASISKPISAMGVLLLVQSGVVSLDEKVNRKLTSWVVPETDLTRASPITVRMLLNHTGGVTHDDSGSYVPYSPADHVPTLVQILKGESPARRGSIRVVSLPGKSFAYSGAGYEILQQLVTDVSGKSFEEYMQSQVLRPIGMTSSTFALPHSLMPIAATGHYAGGRPLEGRFRVGPELAVAGLWTTPTDIARYLINVQQSYGGSVEQPLNVNLTHEMLSPGLGSRGLGPAISGTGQSARFGHDGFNEGFESSFVGYIHEGRGAVVMANSGFAFMLIKEVLDSISRVYSWPEYGPTAQQPPAASVRQQLVMAVSRQTLAASPGEYKMDGAVAMRIFARGNRLLLDSPGNGIAEIFATPGGRFYCPQLIFSDVGSPWLQFIAGPGRITTRIMAGDDGSVEFKRVN
jgi:CubicO group peptidase (beta-lactamase class C family)